MSKCFFATTEGTRGRKLAIVCGYNRAGSGLARRRGVSSARFLIDDVDGGNDRRGVGVRAGGVKGIVGGSWSTFQSRRGHLYGNVGCRGKGCGCSKGDGDAGKREFHDAIILWW